MTKNKLALITFLIVTCLCAAMWGYTFYVARQNLNMALAAYDKLLVGGCTCPLRATTAKEIFPQRVESSAGLLRAADFQNASSGILTSYYASASPLPQRRRKARPKPKVKPKPVQVPATVEPSSDAQAEAQAEIDSFTAADRIMLLRAFSDLDIETELTHRLLSKYSTGELLMDVRRREDERRKKEEARQKTVMPPPREQE